MKRATLLIALAAAFVLAGCNKDGSSIGCSATSTYSWCKLFQHH